mmetsp:Transcript_7795/g.16674  ORF Transcript_7795/g.16674 Transcript_7795/m.16674 type:complete len:208 (-) Transcript_7795:150-773(-)|eukprot:CAMPEP_0171341988 /NCGR_PEP_ID=MMETSP0878-20121228/12769_1 /TAXON_ID=67004 /ORGANISM="Thalassiosira weissflogii, Strain CCMP1336" /LENGTH=207 /DNA_ID=CAMNT_0011844495 /DNA_START=43 /DNA_END=666 /DNA_ORIENTATION=-
MNFQHNRQEPTVAELLQALEERDERIALLEKEIIGMKLELANAKTNEDHLKLEISSLKGNREGSHCSDVSPQSLPPRFLQPRHGSSLSKCGGLETLILKKTRFSPETTETTTIAIQDRDRATAEKLRIGSCASGINFMANGMKSIPSITGAFIAKKVSSITMASRGDLTRNWMQQPVPKNARQNEDWDFNAIALRKESNIFLRRSIA